MRLLLDTHSFLWWVTDDPRLPASARAAIGDEENTIYISAAGAWGGRVGWRLAGVSTAGMRSPSLHGCIYGVPRQTSPDPPG
jgi:hypothetical protein